jgi:hypothetical protein
MSPNNPTPEVPEESKDRFKVAVRTNTGSPVPIPSPLTVFNLTDQVYVR